MLLASAYLPFFRTIDAEPLVLSAAQALFAGMEMGHTCITLTTLAQSLGLDRALLQTMLQQSALVGKAGEFAPLILDQERLYLARFWFEEERVARLLQGKMGLLPVDPVRIRQILNTLFPAAEIVPDWQKCAAALTLLQRLTLITGGPGTGKTTTLTRLLVALFAAQANPLRIGLAAPTGKAAARMQAAIRQAKQTIPVQFTHLLAGVPEEACTLHRLLRINPLRAREDVTPLKLDVLVVDEASMIDLPMMSLLLQSLPQDARLILLGDQDQLASVEPGAVFASLCAGQGYSAGLAHLLDQLLGLPGTKIAPTSVLSDAIVRLTHSYRFAADSGIGALAQAVNRGDVTQTLQVLAAQHAAVVWQPDKTCALQEMVAGYQTYFQAAQQAEVPMTTLFTFWDAFRVLTPLREGPQGSIALNQKISMALAGSRSTTQPWYSGRAIMITENDPDLGLYNGDIGLAREMDGEMYVYFADDAQNMRRFPPGRLPQHETAFVMTVHKSQGSEFDRVYCYLPDNHTPVMTRALFYTAITRARQQVTVCGQAMTITRMLGTPEYRESGLMQRLALSAPVPGQQLSLFAD